MMIELGQRNCSAKLLHITSCLLFFFVTDDSCRAFHLHPSPKHSSYFRMLYSMSQSAFISIGSHCSTALIQHGRCGHANTIQIIPLIIYNVMENTTTSKSSNERMNTLRQRGKKEWRMSTTYQTQLILFIHGRNAYDAKWNTFFHAQRMSSREAQAKKRCKIWVIRH